MSKWLKSLDDYILKCRELNKCPLEYVVRSQVAVKPNSMDPVIDYENVDQENRVNMEQNGKKIAPYWLVLREYCLPPK